jgi:hypothetical protein
VPVYGRRFKGAPLSGHAAAAASFAATMRATIATVSGFAANSISRRGPDSVALVGVPLIMWVFNNKPLPSRVVIWSDVTKRRSVVRQTGI